MHFISLWAMLVVHTSIQIMIYWPVRHCWQPSSQVTQSSWSESAASPIQEQASHHESAELVLLTWKRKMHDTDVHDNQIKSVLACVRESKMTPAGAVCVHTVACGSPGGQRTGPVYTCLPLMIRISVPPLSHFWCYFSLTSADKLGASLTVITICEED